MLNILIKETDSFFRDGLQRFLGEFFFHNFRHQLHFEVELTPENVSAADIIFLSLCQGETLTCYPELQARKKGIVIGLVDDEQRFSAFPSCFQDMIFISRRASLDRISEALFIAWYRTQLPGYRWKNKSCYECQHKILSPQQIRVMVNFYRGLSVGQIANKLNTSDKTIFTHKYLLMQKFDLRSDFELMALIHRMVEKNAHPNRLRDYLVNNYG
ncbi:LuxR C-terminal-related transcriptional regulator [Enterobacter chuandaensis]|uniref:LuxR C-terminal-related transcriptional regulator n=1 Tax=Enterobacter chuandaensis TaxID=2497875 RepID=UPI000E748F1A|nr:LuxR C-terminal-related transcriptional regulator [Enterobacter chuandaensis]RJL04703.1 DNA-binding response regulator [Enterobacter chuandaensis]